MNETIPTLSDKQAMEQIWPGGGIRFGVTDSKTGEFNEGYYDKNGKMCYRNPIPWWRRMFEQKDIHPVWGDWEYVEVLEIQLFSNNKMAHVPIYRSVNLFTGEERFSQKVGRRFRQIDTNAYKQGAVISL